MEKGDIDEAQTSAERVYQALRADIISLVLPPDSVLSRKVLAETHDVSPTPVREALLRLEQEGFVSVFRQSRTVVTRIDPAALHRAQILRMTLACEIATRLANRGKPVPVDLANETRSSFLQTLFDAAGLGDILTDIAPATSVLDRFQALVPASETDTAKAAGFHRDILGRIAARDADGAAQAMRAYLSGDLSHLGALQKERPELFTA